MTEMQYLFFLQDCYKINAITEIILTTLMDWLNIRFMAPYLGKSWQNC